MTTRRSNALATAGELERLDGRDELRPWLHKQHYTVRHPYTDAAPGGWAWTDLPGGVPDADDTAGAALALRNLDSDAGGVVGAFWLMDLRNADGGWPTFCRGWGRLPFDRSGCDLTAHALRAISCHLRRTIHAGMDYLARNQRPDGSLASLWFGNQHHPDEENRPTARPACWPPTVT